MCRFAEGRARASRTQLAFLGCSRRGKSPGSAHPQAPSVACADAVFRLCAGRDWTGFERARRGGPVPRSRLTFDSLFYFFMLKYYS
jgi:hypothetical protein